MSIRTGRRSIQATANRSCRFETLEHRTLLSISGTVFDDLDRDGVFEQEEPGLENRVVYLDVNQDGQLDSTDLLTLSDANGYYAFHDVPVGESMVGVLAEAGWELTFPTGASGPGTLYQIQSIQEVEAGIPGVHDPRVMEISPDGNYFYVFGGERPTLSVFRRDAESGTLLLVEELVSELGITRMTLSPDGKHLYATEKYEERVTIFERDIATGTLTSVGQVETRMEGSSERAYPVDVAVSSDGAHVYVSNPYRYSVITYDRNPVNGQLSYAGAVRFAGMADNWGNGDMTISPDGKYVYATSLDFNLLAVLRRNADTGELTHVETIENESRTTQELRESYEVAVSPDSRFVYSVNSIDSVVAVFHRDPQDGTLTQVQRLENLVDLDCLAGVRQLVISPDGENVYAVAEGVAAVVIFQRDLQSGMLTFRGTLGSQYPGNLSPSILEVSPDGRNVYVGDHGGRHSGGISHGGVNVYRRAYVPGVHTVSLSPGDSRAELDFGYGGDGAVDARADHYHVNEDGVVEEDVSSNDADGLGGTVQLVEGPLHGSLTLTPGGSFAYTPARDFNGIDVFTYQAGESGQESNVAVVTISVDPVNDPPVAVGESYRTPLDTQLVIPAAGVLANDTDPDQDVLTVVLADDALHGTVTLREDGSLAYLPEPGFIGIDTFTYRADDGTAVSQPATVTVAVGMPEISGTVFSDANRDGVRDPDEQGLEGWTIEIQSLATGDLLQTFENPWPYNSDDFGSVVAGTHDRVAIGAPGDDSLVSDAGSAFLFDIVTGEEVSTLIGPDQSAGWMVAAEGDHVYLNVPQGSEGDGQSRVGYMFDGATGGLLGSIGDSLDENIGFYGRDIAADDNLVLIGDAWYETDNQPQLDGAAMLFDSLTGELLRTFVNPTSERQVWFGTSLDLAGDRVLIGAKRHTAGGVYDSGSAFLYDALTGELLHSFSSPDPDDPGFFGQSVALVGGNVLVGAPGERDAQIVNQFGDPVDDVGAAYLFDGETGELLLTLADPQPAGGDRFGYCVAAVGEDLLVSAPADDREEENVGAVFLFDGETGELLHTFENPTPDGFDYFGWSLAAVGNDVLVGSPNGDVNGIDAGKVFLLQGYTAPITTITDADGNYAFDDLPPGTYVIRQTLRDEFRQTTPAAPGTHTIVPAEGDTLTDLDFGNLQNTYPTAVDDSYVAPFTGTMMVAAPGLLANDTDADGDPLTVSLLVGPDRGSVTVLPDGAFNYTPQRGFVGETTFTYLVEDGYGGSDSATVTIECPPLPTIAIDDVAVQEGNLGDSEAVFTLHLSRAVDVPVRVNVRFQYGTADLGLDFRAMTLSATFAPGETETTVSVSVVGDMLPEGDETFSAILSAPTNGRITDGRGVCTIIDDDVEVEGVRLELSPESGYFVAAPGLSLRMAVNVVDSPEPLLGFGLAFDNWNVDGGWLQLHDWVPDAAWQLPTDTNLNAPGDTYVAGGSSEPVSAPTTLGTFALTAPAKFGRYLLSPYYADGGEFDTTFTSAAGPVPVEDPGTVFITVVNDTAPPEAELLDPVPDGQTAEDLGYIDVQWSDAGTQVSGIHAGTIDASDLTIETGGRRLSIDQVQSQGAGVWRYYYGNDGDRLFGGTVHVILPVGEVADVVGNRNVEMRWSFTYSPTGDGYEPNDTLATAFDLSAHQQTWLSELDGPGVLADADWYLVNMPEESSRLLVDLSFARDDGVMGVQIVDEAGIIVFASNSTGDGEQLDAILSSSGPWYLRVYGADAGSGYDLRWTAQSIRPSTVSGTVFEDFNRNGVRDPGEAGLAGWPVELREQSSYSSVRTLVNPSPAHGDAFGSAIVGFGSDILIAAETEDLGDGPVGGVYLFDGQTGEVLQTFRHPDPSIRDNFGHAVAAAGDQVLVGADADDTDGGDAGIAFLFDGATGALLRTFHNPSPGGVGASPSDHFGYAVAAVGSAMLVTAPHEDAGAPDAGAAYLFDGETGQLLNTLEVPAPNLPGSFGWSAAAAGDRIVIGAPGDDTRVENAGAAYVFDAATGDMLFSLPNPEPAKDDYFGISVAFAGQHVLVGASRNDTGATDAGIAYLFHGNTGELLLTMANPTPQAYDFFGNQVAGVGEDLLIGTQRDDTAGRDAGAAYLFDGVTGQLLHTYLPPEGNSGGAFGSAVGALGQDVLVGEPGNRSVGIAAGAAHRFAAYFEPVVTSTDAEGNYSFQDVGEGTYTVRQIIADDYAPSYPDNGDPHTVTISEADQISGIDFGSYDLLPVATDDRYAADEDTPLLISAAEGVLANDANFAEVEAALVEAPQHGSVTIEPDGSFRYVPEEEFHGIDRFWYAAHEGDYESETAKVTITVLSINDAPVAVDDDYAVAAGDVLAVSVPGVLVNDFDTDSSTISVRLADGTSHGTLELNADGSFTYTPAPGFTGADEFSYYAVDGVADSAQPATVTISVDPAIVAGRVFEDLDRDGQYDPGEPGLAGWQVEIESDYELGDLIHTLHSSSSPSRSEEFGSSVAALGSDLLVGATRSNDEYGAVYWFDGLTGELIHTFTDPEPQPTEGFGSAIAVHGNRILITAGTKNVGDDTYAGTVFLFDAATKELIRTITNPDPGSGAFGGSVAFVGNNYLIGCPGAIGFYSDSGKVFLFDGESGGLLHTFENSHGGKIGGAVAGVGDNILIGAPFDYTGGPRDHGGAYYFDGSTYELIHYLQEPIPKKYAQFGSAVAALGDDLVIGAEKSSLGAEYHGAVYVFDGETGELLQAIANPIPAGNGGKFGGVLAARDDYLLVGARGANSYDVAAGAAYLYSASTGELVREFMDPDPGRWDSLGASVAFVGADALVGASSDSSFVDGAGAAFFFAGPSEPHLTTSDEDGSFSASGIPEGKYVVRQTPPEDYIRSTPDGDGTYTVSLDSDDAATDLNFGYYQNETPIANSDTYSVAQNGMLTVDAPGLLDNDEDHPADELSASLVTGPTHGSLTLAPDGSFEYAPESDYVGTDSFIYAASDGPATSEEAVVTLIVGGHPGDANFSGATDLSDFNIWNAHKFRMGTDWHRADFNGDGITDLSDFNIWNAHKFTSAPAPPVAHDAVLQQAGIWNLEDAIWDDTAWLHALERTSLNRQADEDRNWAEDAVDKLLATYWP